MGKTTKKKTLQNIKSKITYGKKYFWLLRHFIYLLLRKSGSTVLLLTFASSIYMLYFTNDSTLANKQTTASFLILENNEKALLNVLKALTKPPSAKRYSSLLDTIKGVNYYTSNSWFQNYHALNRAGIEKDFSLMKSAGINTIKKLGPDIFDQNVINIAKQEDLKIIYTIAIPESLDFQNDVDDIHELREQILKVVKRYSHSKTIIAWNFNNDVFDTYRRKYNIQNLQTKYEAYLDWLRITSKQIKTIDSSKLICINIKQNSITKDVINVICNSLPNIDAVGIVPEELGGNNIEYSDISLPFFYNSVPASELKNISKAPNKGVIINQWQDRITNSFVSLNGLIDHKARRKIEFFETRKLWNNDSMSFTKTNIKILKPAMDTYSGSFLYYYAMIYENSSWTIISKDNPNIIVEWYLVKLDQWGNQISMKPAGNETTLQLKIPVNPETYKLLLSVSKNGITNTFWDSLNTPLEFTSTED